MEYNKNKNERVPLFRHIHMIIYYIKEKKLCVHYYESI